jgi:hypothetical protein
MRLRPPHILILAYAEWCIETGRVWPKLARVAHDVCRSKVEIQRAFGDLQAAGLLSSRYAGDGLRLVVTLPDGRETRAYPPPISTVVLRTKSMADGVESRHDETRIAA